MRSSILNKQRFVARLIYLTEGVPTEASLRNPLNFLCINVFAGRTNEDELFPVHSKFWDYADEIHRVSARKAH